MVSFTVHAKKEANQPPSHVSLLQIRYAGTASTTQNTPRQLTMRVSLNPALARSALHCAAVRSRP
jgi:hypothetical protein